MQIGENIYSLMWHTPGVIGVLFSRRYDLIWGDAGGVT